MCFEASDNDATKMAALREELTPIYLADVQYWRQGTKAGREATWEYQGRQDRVRVIRREFRDLLNTKALFGTPVATFPASQRLPP
jgi:hypothetical protein